MEFDEKVKIINEIKADLPGMLSDVDIRNSMKLKKMSILPFTEKKLTGLGYNLSPSGFVFSTSKGFAEEVKNRNGEKYVQVDPHDTVLVLTKEYLWLDRTLAGTIHSRVRIVSQGFGHISTTIDPLWRGPLLISLNNPTSKKLKLVIEKTSVRGIEDNTFCTVVFQKLITAAEKVHDNPPQRIDVLKEYIAKQPRFLPFYRKRYEKFKDLVLNLQDNLPGNREYDTPSIGKLNILKSKYSKIKDSIIAEELLYKNQSRIPIDDTELTDETLFSEYVIKNMKDSVNRLKNVNFCDNYNKNQLKEDIINIEDNIDLEIQNKDYMEYLSYLEKNISEMQPLGLRIAGQLRKSYMLIIVILIITGIIYLNWSSITTTPLWQQVILSGAFLLLANIFLKYES
ncbi:dCTP deaminase domain-containing protein [Acetobacterium woodii]|uniref:Deoxycytidine triphosphate deaminase n=1 Tax=Acetobacterium woodii (strain ATCC 29683 / DSM 1030 / JCM 2381 / KCTC 1655 / WB1) TaxID=931626 RepID=H6LFT7_ACEWD|nr:hypothetical protein [Acetobacterium woodii]AFA48225.1 hypothetical protein Awo_c14420 [Acetobacterium woodii DSM 1030]